MKSNRILFGVATLLVGMMMGASVHAESLFNVSLVELGATAKGSGVSFNKDWPANNTLKPDKPAGGGVLMNSMKGGRIDIHLILPVEIKAIEVVGLDYHGTRQPKAIDIFVDGNLVKHAELPETPGKPVNVPLEAKGQNVGIVITDEYPVPTLPDGKPGLHYGGWARLRVMSSTNVAELMKAPDNYNVTLSPVNIAPTAGSDAAGGKIEVVGQPRETKGHPCTLWDAEDIAHYKEMLKTSPELQKQFEGLKRSMDVRITQPLGIPQPKKGPDGQWLHLGDMEQFEGRTYGSIHNQLGLDIANLGMVYVLTGDPKYGEFCKKLLLAYADAHPNYGIGARPTFRHDPSKVFDQRLSDATWLIQVARGYDLVYNLPSITPDERKHIEDDLIKGNARHITGNHSTLEGATNWSAIDTCGVLTAAYATDDQELLNIAFYGLKGTKEKPTGGVFLKHFGTQSISADGMWVEGAMGYQFMALQALIMDAEMMWHHGIDMYRYRDCALKSLFDSPLQYSYPDLTTPALHDSHHGSIVGGDSFLYEYAYRRYRDPSYLLILNQTGTHLDAHFQQFPVSVLYDRDPQEKVAPVEWKSVNFFSVGYGVLRNTTEAATNSLLLEYGPAGSHGHPDKLTLDLYAFNAQLSPDPGCIWYEQPLYPQWYRTTLGHNTLVVDELDQLMTGAQQVVYGSAETMGIQRAWTQTAYPGVTMDRAVFFTPNYAADIFGAFARLPRKLDLAWHIIGEFGSDLKTEPMKFPEPMEQGYVALGNVKHATTDKAWSASVTHKNNVARFVAAGGTPTEVIVGDGHYERERPPTIIERRKTNATVYGNAIDISGAKDGYVKSVTQEGSLELGYGLLKVETPKGTDLCFASYRPGTFKAGELETDALQAFVLKDGKEMRAMFLGGGKLVKIAGATLERSQPGLASVEKTETGGYVVANVSSSPAAVTVASAALNGMEAFNLNAKGKRIDPATVTKSGGNAFAVQLNGMAKVEFSPKGAMSQLEFRENLLRKRQTDQEAVLSKAREDCTARTKVSEAAAKANPAPANTVLVVGAADFSAQGGGEVKVGTNKRAAVGPAITSWNGTGHWLEWNFDVPTEGYYGLTACYCSETDLIEREIQINGEVQEPFAPMVLPSTGGFANGSDDWRIFTAMNPVSKQPLLIKLKQGKNIVRLTNTNDRAMVVNYLAITSPDVKVTREMLAGKIKQ